MAVSILRLRWSQCILRDSSKAYRCYAVGTVTCSQRRLLKAAGAVCGASEMHVRVQAIALNYSSTLHLSGTATSPPLSPAVRYMVDSHALDPSLIPASGPHARLLKGDVLHYMENKSSIGQMKETTRSKPFQKPSSMTPPIPSQQLGKHALHPARVSQTQFTDIPVSDGHRVEAMSSVQSKMSIPHSYASIQCDLEPLLSVLHQTEKGEGAELIWLDSFLVKAAAHTLQQLPHSNAVWNGDRLQLLPTINIAVRVSSGGILISTPIIRSANRVSVERIVSVIEAAGTGNAESKGFTQDAAFMISSLTSTHLSHYTAVVQPPLSAVLTIAGLQTVCSDVITTSSTSVSASLSCDSRVLDSDLASQWLHQFKTNVELHSAL